MKNITKLYLEDRISYHTMETIIKYLGGSIGYIPKKIPKKKPSTQDVISFYERGVKDNEMLSTIVGISTRRVRQILQAYRASRKQANNS